MQITVSDRKAALRDAYGETLVEIGRVDPDVVALTGDLAESTRLNLFAEAFPDRFFNLGVAEANLMGVAAGLALSGKKPFVSTFAVFATGKPWEQIRQVIAYQSAPVRIVATHAGLTVGEDGASHQMLEDINNMRVLPNMAVIVPADSEETRQVIRFLRTYDRGPVYVRLTRTSFPVLFEGTGYRFEFGRMPVIRDGGDVTLVGTGLMVSQCLKAAELLAREGISARVVNASTIKPIDRETLVACARETGAVVTAEEHQITGGLGSAVAEVLVEECPVPMARVGVRDVFGESGEAFQLIEHYGLTPERIAEAARSVIARKAGRISQREGR